VHTDTDITLGDAVLLLQSSLGMVNMLATPARHRLVQIRSGLNVVCGFRDARTAAYERKGSCYALKCFAWCSPFTVIFYGMLETAGAKVVHVREVIVKVPAENLFVWNNVCRIKRMVTRLWLSWKSSRLSSVPVC